MYWHNLHKTISVCETAPKVVHKKAENLEKPGLCLKDGKIENIEKDLIKILGRKMTGL